MIVKGPISSWLFLFLTHAGGTMKYAYAYPLGKKNPVFIYFKGKSMDDILNRAFAFFGHHNFHIEECKRDKNRAYIS